MSTWHQDKAGTKLYHETEWTVVVDPPNDTRCLFLFSTRTLAMDYLERVKRTWPHDHGLYILPPAKESEMK